MHGYMNVKKKCSSILVGFLGEIVTSVHRYEQDIARYSLQSPVYPCGLSLRSFQPKFYMHSQSSRVLYLAVLYWIV
jgi:hypothetical protein